MVRCVVSKLPADSFPTTNIKGFGRCAGGARSALRAVERKLLRETRRAAGGAIVSDCVLCSSVVNDLEVTNIFVYRYNKSLCL